MDGDGQHGSKIRNTVAKVLKENGLKNRGSKTGTWEGPLLTASQVGNAITELQKLLDIAKSYDFEHSHLDHLWIYVSKERNNSQRDIDEPAEETTTDSSAPAK